MRLEQYIEEATAKLTRAGVDSPRLSAQVLAHESFCEDKLLEERGSARLFCLMEAQRELTPEETGRMDIKVDQRAAGQPLAHITGHREFYGREFLVTPHTLIPRPETELVIETALELMPGERLHFADLGTGTGCIGLTLAAEQPQWRGVLLDISPDALATAAQNALRLGLQDSTAILRGDMARPPLGRESLALLVSNPPYIAEAERHLVMEEVLQNEPSSALFSPQEGLQHLRSAIAAANHALLPGGLVVLEHGANQGAAVRKLLEQGGNFKKIETRRDLAQLERCTLARKGI